MQKESVFAIIKKSIQDVLYDVTEKDITVDKRLKDLGANSIDRADIVIRSMEGLNLKIPLVELAEAKNIDDLVNIFYKKINGV